MNRAWIWLAAIGGIALLVVIAISETRERRDAVRARQADQPPLATQP